MVDTMKQRNVDSAILFMQQEHAKTLKGLHEEISNLQKRCSELNFQVAMANTSVSQEDEYRAKCQSLEEQLSVECKKVKALEEEIQQKDKRINILEQKVNSRDRKIQDLKESHKQDVQDLQTQLNTKSDTIAVLTSKLHQLHQQINHPSVHVSPGQSSHGSRTSSASSSAESAADMRKSTEGLSRHYRHHISPNCDLSSKHAPVPPLKPPARVRSGRRIPQKPQTPENIPDPTPFLSREDEELHLAKKERTVLPPINHSVTHTMLSAQRAKEFGYGKKVNHDAGTLGVRSPEMEVETLAMSAVAHKEQRLHRPRHYKSTE